MHNRLNAFRSIQWFLFGEQFIESKTRFPCSALDHFNAWCQTVELRAHHSIRNLLHKVEEKNNDSKVEFTSEGHRMRVTPAYGDVIEYSLSEAWNSETASKVSEDIATK